MDHLQFQIVVIQVSEVTKQQAQNTRHRYRLFARLNQDVDRDGMDEREDDVIGPDGKRIKIEGETKEPKEAAENPDEIQIEDSSDEENQDTKKPKKEEEKKEKEEEEEEEDAYDPYMDPNLDDLDDAEIQDARQMEAPYSYWPSFFIDLSINISVLFWLVQFFFCFQL